MSRAAAASTALVQRLRSRAAQLVATRIGERRRAARSGNPDWRSATALWPDFTAEPPRN